jgi:hypothetical protein
VSSEHVAKAIKPSRSIVRNHITDLCIRICNKKGDRRSALPTHPAKTAGQSTERQLQLTEQSRLELENTINLRRRGPVRTPGLRSAFVAPRLRQWTRGNNQRVATDVVVRQPWIGWHRHTVHIDHIDQRHCRIRTRRSHNHSRTRRDNRNRSIRRDRDPSPTTDLRPSPNPTTMESRSHQ